MNPVDFSPFARALVEAKRFAQDVGEMKRSRMSWELWEEKYSNLTREVPGVIGDITARGAPHVMRLAMIYALLDQSKLIKEVHLEAALEVWRTVATQRSSSSAMPRGMTSLTASLPSCERVTLRG
jgi:hypothetical protein